VLGPGNLCDFAHRSTYVGDIPDMTEVLQAATGQLSSGEEVFYPSTLAWNSRLSTGSTMPTSSHSTLPLPASPIFPLLKRAYIIAAAISLVVVYGLAVYPDTGQQTTLRRLAAAGVLSILVPILIALGMRALAEGSSKRPAHTFSSSAAPTCPLPPPKNPEAGVELITMKELDNRVLSMGYPKCECTFLQSIDMDTLAIRRARAMTLELMQTRVNDASNTPADSDSHNSCSAEKKIFSTVSSEAIPLSSLSKNDVGPLETMQCYIREFLAKPNPKVGRKGPTCPFVPTSLKLDLISLAIIRKNEIPTVESLEEIVMSLRTKFTTLPPLTGNQAQYKAIILVLPDISLDDAPVWIDGLQKKLKPEFVKDGIMLGEFHLRNNATGLHNTSFYPLRTPYPALAIRYMVPSDIVFLNDSDISRENRRSMIERYLEKFGDTEANKAQSVIARGILDKLMACP
jgi:hypothetical protein